MLRLRVGRGMAGGQAPPPSLRPFFFLRLSRA